MWPAACLLACIAAGEVFYIRSLRVRRPPTPSAAKLPASARILLQPIRHETVDLTVPAREELNYRVGMQAGAALVYAWSTGGRGETLECEFAGQQKTAASEAHSAFVAQSSGWYRWRWKNPGSRPITIHLKLSGSYEPASMAPASTAPASIPPASMAPASMAPASIPPASMAPASMAPATIPAASMAPATIPPASMGAREHGAGKHTARQHGAREHGARKHSVGRHTV